LLRQKLLVAGALSVLANLILPFWAYLVGGMFFGFGPATSPVGGTFTTGESLWRLLVIVVFVCGQMLVVAALAFLLSVSVDNPLGAVGGAVSIPGAGTFRHTGTTRGRTSCSARSIGAT
jgi:ABC-2 type transport system permease protein